MEKETDIPNKDDSPEKKHDAPPNPMEELGKQLEKIFGGKNVRFEFAPGGAFPPPPESAQGSPRPQQPPDDSDKALEKIRKFSMKPREIRDYLNRFVIKQDEAKKVLAVSICDHYNHVRRCLENPSLNNAEFGKQNILILGPTGVGKTYLMRTIAKLIGVPFVKADATKFSETGYVGADVEDLVRDLVKTANGNAELAQYGIIYIDEIDKIAGRSDAGGRDVSGRGVQINLLKLMEDSTVNIVSPQDMMGQMQMAMLTQRGKKPKRTISTRHILFIVSGAFDKMGESIAKRLDKNRIGFAPDNSPEEDEKDPSDYLKFAETRDFIKYGFEAEFIGRLPVRVACEALKADDLANILVSSEGSILRQYKEDFAGYGIDFSVTSEAIKLIAEKAHAENTGARGLMTVLERTLRDFKFELPSSGIGHFELDTRTMDNPREALKKLLIDNADLMQKSMALDIDRFSEKFRRETSFKLVFPDDTVKAIIALSVERDKSPHSVCGELFRDYEHGLAIVSRNTGAAEFTIPAQAVSDPDKYLSELVVDSFKKKD